MRADRMSISPVGIGFDNIRGFGKAGPHRFKGAGAKRTTPIPSYIGCPRLPGTA
jgi:hypothetical protein